MEAMTALRAPRQGGCIMLCCSCTQSELPLSHVFSVASSDLAI